MCLKILVCSNLTATTILPRNLHGEILALDAYTGDSNHGFGPIWATGNLEFLGDFGVKFLNKYLASLANISGDCNYVIVRKSYPKRI